MSKLLATVAWIGLAGWIAMLMCGVLVTALPPYSEGAWFVWPLLRLAGVFGCALVFLAGFGFVGGGQWQPPAKAAVVVLGLSVLFNINPLLDVVRGPFRGQGRIEGAGVERGSLVRSTGGRTGTIEGELRFVTDEGQVVELEPIGMQANRLEDMLVLCSSGRGRLAALRHLDVPLSLDCR